jgi:hypothetical protein
MRGVAAFTILQTLIGIAPLFWVRLPSLREVAMGLAAGGVALIITTSIGHAVSARFPRPIEGQGPGQLPMHLAWIPLATMAMLTGALAGMYAIGNAIARGGGVVALLIALTITVAGYNAILPRLGAVVDAYRERIASM